MEQIWLKSYPPGMPTEVDTTQYRSLVQLLEESFHKFADRNAVSYTHLTLPTIYSV